MSETKLIVMLPNPAMGHLPSNVEFAKLLVQRDQRFSILFVIPQVPSYITCSAVNTYIESQAREIDSNRITFFTLPPLTTSDPTSQNYFGTVLELQKPLFKKAVEDRGTKPTAFVFDHLYVTMMDIANELGVPSYIYFITCANLLNVFFHVQSLADDEGVDVVFTKSTDPDAELDVPGFKNRLPLKVLPWFGVADNYNGNSSRLTNEWLALLLDIPRKLRESKGIVVNSIMELESCAIQALLDQGKSNKIPAVYPVGPLLTLDGRSRGDGDPDLIMRWLDEQPFSSVVYLCFGSMGGFDVDQVKEIANGLDRSGYRFLWSLQRPYTKDKAGNDNYQEALPEGFMERMAHRGKIIKWAPQVQILAHKAIGGFVTHSGWNSMLESLWFGVPLATWPIYAEQQINAFQVAKELGLAVEISRVDYRLNFRTGKGNYLVTAEEVENGVKRLMNLDEEMRGRVQEIRDISRNALKDGGSSNNWLLRFIEDVLYNERS